MVAYGRARTPGKVDPAAVTANVAAGYLDAQLADSPLVVHSMGEASGTTMQDSSGNSRNGTYSSATVGAAGMIMGSTSVDFNGSSSTAQISDAAWMDVNAITVEAIVNFDAFGPDSRPIACRYAASDAVWILYEEGSTGGVVRWYCIDTTGSAKIVSSAALTVGTTYHIAATYDATADSKLYVNGSQVGTTATGNALRASALPINWASWPQIPAYLDGRLQGCAIYGSALPAARLLAHAQAAGLA